MKLFELAFVVFLVVAAFAGGYVLRAGRSSTTAPGPGASPERKVLYWVDPMHPAYKSDKPGTAPDCGMALEPVYADDGAPAASREPSRILYYRDPKDPGYTAHTAGVNPETGNTLEPVYADAGRKVLYYRDPKAPTYTATTAGINPETGNTLEPVYAEVQAGAATPAGAVRIPVERQQLAGVTYATVESTDIGRTLRTVGKVAYDETRLTHVHPRVDGWIEKVFVDFTGELVKKGQPMLTIYSPEMLASQEELLLARRARDTMQHNPLASAAQQGESLFQAARRRLQLWNLSEDQIDKVLETGQPIRSITLYAPASGFVLERNAFPNQRITSESDLYSLADLSKVWVMADIYEADLAAVRVGAPARIVLPYGQTTTTITAKVNYVQPGVDPTTRTLKLRLEAGNPGLRLRPEMFVNVEFDLTGSRRLSVPADAVLNSGERQVVFVDLGNGYLLPKDVQTGERVGDRIVVTSGLADGERVVASGTFLVDAESQLESALGSMAGHQHGGSGETPKPTAPPAQPGPAAPAGPQTTPKAPQGHRHD